MPSRPNCAVTSSSRRVISWVAQTRLFGGGVAHDLSGSLGGTGLSRASLLTMKVEFTKEVGNAVAILQQVVPGQPAAGAGGQRAVHHAAVERGGDVGRPHGQRHATEAADELALLDAEVTRSLRPLRSARAGDLLLAPDHLEWIGVLGQHDDAALGVGGVEVGANDVHRGGQVGWMLCSSMGRRSTPVIGIGAGGEAVIAEAG